MFRTEDTGELMLRAQGGDPDAFDALVRILHDAVYGYARRTLGDLEQAKEVTQDTFVRAYVYRKSFDPEVGTVRAWMLTIAVNRARDALRARARAPIPVEDLSHIAAPSEDGLRTFERSVLREQVLAAVEALSPMQREVVTLRYLSELSYKDIARMLGVTSDAAKMRALRARDALARSLARFVPRPQRGRP